jgi:hypothetical protein
VTTFDLTILPIHRVNGQETAELPGLLAVTPPRRTARGREHDNLIAYLMLSGNAAFSAVELKALLNATATAFYQTSGSLTFAMRKTAENINAALLERNLATTGRGQYALGCLALAVVRAEQCTLLLSGPTHAVWVSEGKSRYIHDAALSGKGLGSGQSVQSYFSQVEFHTQDLLALCGKFPKDWEADLLNERPPTSLEASYRKLTLTQGDLNAALIQTHVGHGTITILRPEVSAARQPVSVVVAEPPEQPVTEQAAAPIEKELDETLSSSPVATSSITEEELDALADFAAHIVQPSAYAIPPQPDVNPPLPKQEQSSTTVPRGFPSSIPRVASSQPVSQPISQPFSAPVMPPAAEPEIEEMDEEAQEESIVVERKPARVRSNAHAEATRTMAKVAVGGIKIVRRVNERITAFMQKFLPRLLPGVESHPNQPVGLPTYLLVFIALVIPVLVSVVSWIVYDKYGLSERYRELYVNATVERDRAVSETDPARQRDHWNNVLDLTEQAVEYRDTPELKLVRDDAQANLDRLMGVLRLEFIPAFANGISGATQISRLAASESDLYMLDAERGSILHASFTGRSLEMDNTFNCQPGTHAGREAGPLVDILALPKVNAVGATVLGIDTTGNLLYCSPGQVPQVFPLPALPNTNWGRINAFALDSGNLYVLDAMSRSVWVFAGKDSSFTDTPYFYFSNQIPNIESAIDMAVSGDDLYLLHADGHLTTCTFSRIAETPTRCQDPAPRIDNFPAHRDIDIFAQANLTQMTLTNPPNPIVLLLDAPARTVYRLSPRSLELQNQVTGFAGEDSPFQPGPVGAMTVSPNYVLYLSIGNQVYFTTDLP